MHRITSVLVFFIIASLTAKGECWVNTQDGTPVYQSGTITDVDNLGTREYPASTPLIVSNLFANMATSLKAVSPGEVISVIGRGLANNQTSAWSTATPWAEKLSDTELLLDGNPIPLVYAGRRRDGNALSLADAEIIAQIPNNVIPGNQVTLQVRLSDQSGKTCVGNLVTLAITKATPALLAISVEATSNSPVELYALGLGAIRDKQLPAGTNAKTATWLSEPESFRFYIGNQLTSTSYIGLSTAFPGLYQFNINVPSLPNGEYTLRLLMDDVEVSHLPIKVN